MNNIPIRQNSERMLKLLRARSQIYLTATTFQIVQFIGTVIIPVAGAVTGLIWAPGRPYVAIISIAITIVDAIWFDREQRRALKRAAKVSEQFDTELFELPWNGFVSGEPLSAEEISSAGRHWKGGDIDLIDWYPVNVGQAPLHLARILCQRTNLWYDEKLRNAYGRWLILGAALISVALFVAGAMSSAPMQDLVLTVLVPIAPMLLWALREVYRQTDAAASIKPVLKEAESFYQRAASGACSVEECTRRSREFQDAIFARRSANPLMFPLVYWLARPEMERQMDAGADDFLEKAGIDLGV